MEGFGELNVLASNLNPSYEHRFPQCAGFLHLLPEVTENMDTAFDELLNGDQDYPFGYFVVCIGFLTVLIIEHSVLSCEKNKLKVEINEASCRCETVIRSGLPGSTPSVMFVSSSIYSVSSSIYSVSSSIYSVSSSIYSVSSSIYSVSSSIYSVGVSQ